MPWYYSSPAHYSVLETVKNPAVRCLNTLPVQYVIANLDFCGYAERWHPDAREVEQRYSKYRASGESNVARMIDFYVIAKKPLPERKQSP